MALAPDSKLVGRKAAQLSWSQIPAHENGSLTVNQQRRAEVAKIAAAIDSLKQELEAVRDDEAEAFDNMPESFQQSEKGEAAEAAIAALNEAINSLESAIDSLFDAGSA